MKKHILTVVLSGLISIIVFIIGNYLMGNYENKKIANVNLGKEYSVVAGVIRNTGDGWDLIQDDNHETIGISQVEQDDDKLIVRYDKKTKINALSVTVDETMASEGYTVGASVGNAETWIQIFDKEKNLVNPADYINDRGNIWIEGIFKN